MIGNKISLYIVSFNGCKVHISPFFGLWQISIKENLGSTTPYSTIISYDCNEEIRIVSRMLNSKYLRFAKLIIFAILKSISVPIQYN
jgi:hypothetical protein